MQNFTLDEDVKRSFDWFIELLDPDDWNNRKNKIEKYLDELINPIYTIKQLNEPKPISIIEDRMGWYLYLIEKILFEPTKYEPTQGSRIVPLFKRMGADFNLLTKIGGVQDRARRIVLQERRQPDAGLFEILTALLWARNGWERVEFIPVAPPEKRPDLLVSSKDAEWFVECKRLDKSSEYSQLEREKWLSMWRHLRSFLIAQQLPFVLDIVFHVELDTLSDTFLHDELAQKLLLVCPPCQIISNEIWDVAVSLVDLDAARAHLKNNYVKCPSDQLNLLVAGKRDPNKGFTSVVEGINVRLGKGGGSNQYLDEIKFAAGSFWFCDSHRANQIKARDIRQHLSSALRQLPENKKCVVHVGLETLDGRGVEAERYARIINTAQQFDAKGKELEWIYCHLFQSYSPPDQQWVMDETVYSFSRQADLSLEPIRQHQMIGSHDGEQLSGFHWARDTP